jgi:hypothetical protein
MGSSSEQPTDDAMIGNWKRSEYQHSQADEPNLVRLTGSCKEFHVETLEMVVLRTKGSLTAPKTANTSFRTFADRKEEGRFAIGLNWPASGMSA